MLRRRLSRDLGMLCPGCRYVLSRLPSPGACPECGRPFTVESVREWWRVHYGWEHSDKQQSDAEQLQQIARRAGCAKDHESV
jgi:predicted amidophosphoribosyltransferase